MRWIIALTFALFLGILACVWIASERAQPVLIDVDPAAVDLNHHR